jgi:hypothetical protein
MSVPSALFEENKPVIVSTNAYIRSSAATTISVLFINVLDVAATSAAMTSSDGPTVCLGVTKRCVDYCLNLSILRRLNRFYS